MRRSSGLLGWRFLVALAVVAASVAVASCTSDAARRATTEAGAEIRGSLGDSAIREDWMSRLTMRRRTASIGVLVGEATEMFGRIAVGLIGYGGTVWILDDHYFNIRVFKGPEYVATFGGLGFGPGEFRYPKALVYAGRDTVTVLDLARRTMIMLRGRELVSVGSGAVPVGLEAACAFADGSVAQRVLPLEEQASVSLVSNRGGAPRTILPARGHGHPIMRLKANRGPLACGTRGVLVAYDATGEVEEWTRDGALMWRASVPEFVPLALEIRGRGVLQRDPGGVREVHRFLALQSLAPGLALVQIEGRPVGSAGERGDRVVRSFLATDDGGWISIDLGERVLDIREGMMLTASEENGFPQVHIYHLGG